MRLTHGSTFSGIGAPEVAAAMLGWENVFHCEINPFGRQVLDYYFPNAKSYEDITKTDFSEWRGKIDVLTGGFPCQPFSYAGKRGGAEDDRYLWPYMLRCIEQVRPTWFVGENVSGITTMVLPGTETQVGSHSSLFGEGDTYTRTSQRYVIEEICSNLEAIGYSVQPMLIPACAVGAPHRRDRIFILAHNERAASTNTDRNHDDSRDSREYESKSKRVQERNEIQLVEQPDYVRPTMCSSSSNTSSAGCDRPSDGQRRHHVEGGDVLQERSVRVETRRDGEIGTPADTERRGSGTLSAQVRCGLADGERTSSTRSERILTDTESARPLRQERRSLEGETKWQRVWRNTPGHDSTDVSTRWRAFPTVSPICRGNDGLPFDVDNLSISRGKWRTESLKAYGNAIVPQVMYEIFKAIEATYD